MMKFYDIDGNPISEATFIEQASDPASKIVKRTTVPTEVGPFTVSTVALLIDHNWSGEGPPVLWETLTFDQNSYAIEDDVLFMERYTSREAAEKGHEEHVERLRVRLGYSPK